MPLSLINSGSGTYITDKMYLSGELMSSILTEGACHWFPAPLGWEPGLRKEESGKAAISDALDLVLPGICGTKLDRLP